ncbi:hypothetical protein [Streptomyces sp. NPDC045470]|uniref:hypothetical protein n=1 Tax=Streptomyces sp. NPDC045470 TaxID=3155469 RepID=UPI0033D128EA
MPQNNRPFPRWGRPLPRRALLAIVLVSAIAPSAIAVTTPAGAESPRPSGRATPSFGAAQEKEAIVSMGDSYISGEAGRWWSNIAMTESDKSDLYGTDRACMQADGEGNCWNKAPQKIYRDGTYKNPDDGKNPNAGCHRSDVAEVHSADLTTLDAYNLACSGAESKHIWQKKDGGERYKGFPAQADQLQTLLDEKKNVKWIQLSIGGNDLEFSNIIKACVIEYLKGFTGGYCEEKQAPKLKAKLDDPNLDGFTAKVRKTIRQIRAVMGNRPYRLAIQSYPAPIPLAEDFDKEKYPENIWGARSARHRIGGCSFWNKDADWAHGKAVTQISTKLRELARQENADFLDLAKAFDGHEVCHSKTRKANKGDKLPHKMVPSKEAEWMRFLTRGVKGVQQGQEEESLHPNAWGQKALGRCLNLLYGKAQGTPSRVEYQCLNTEGKGVEGMRLEELKG